MTDLRVDYGSRVKNEVMAVLEIPELEAQLKQDQAGIANATEAVTRSAWWTRPKRSGFPFIRTPNVWRT